MDSTIHWEEGDSFREWVMKLLISRYYLMIKEKSDGF